MQPATQSRKYKRKRWSYVDVESFVPSYEREDFNNQVTEMRVAGAKLLEHLQCVYACGKLSAQDFAVACHWAECAGCLGADFSAFALEPGHQSGKYQQKLDRAFPDSNLYTIVNVPRTHPRKSLETTLALKVSLVFESLADEIRHSPGMLERVVPSEWPTAFAEHAVARQCADAG
eukprot:9064010-Pyramimonas_sp.AAC.1